MPTIIQTHLISCETWDKVKKQAKTLEHIIAKCDPLGQGAVGSTPQATVPGLYSHISQSADKTAAEILQPFRGAKPKAPRGKTRGRGKPKSVKTQPQTSTPHSDYDDSYAYEQSEDNYYHNDGYRNRGGRQPFRFPGGGRQFRGQPYRGRGNRGNNYHQPQYNSQQYQANATGYQQYQRPYGNRNFRGGYFHDNNYSQYRGRNRGRGRGNFCG